ncbi:MAG: hypothetical protein R6U38_14275 [Desulfatiglandaceae bacterium]
MIQTIIVFIIIGIALVFTARWTFKRLSGRSASCCGHKGASRPPCASSMPGCCQPPDVGGKRQ